MVREQDVIKPRKITNFRVAFTLKGHMCDRVYDYMHKMSTSSQYTWEDNGAFEDILEYNTYYSSTSGNSKIIFNSSSGRQFGMFMSDFDEVIRQKRFIDNKIKGTFCFCKKGNAQGVRLIFEES